MGAFRDLKLRYKAIVIVLIPVAALLLSIILIAGAQRQQLDAASAVHHTFEVRAHINRLLMLTVEAESAMRGFLLTHDTSFLARYRTAASTIPSLIAELRKLIADHPAQVRRAADLADVAQSRIASLERLRTKAGVSTAELRMEVEMSRVSMQKFRAKADELMREEDHLLGEREADEKRHQERMRNWIGLAAAVGVLGGGVAAALISRSIVRRIEMLTRNAQHLSRGESLEIMNEGDDEIGVLATQFTETAGILATRESQLRETREFLEHLVETSPTVIFAQEPATFRVTYVSPNVESILGFTAAEVLKDADFWLSRIHPDDIDHVVSFDREAFERASPRLETEYRFCNKDGNYLWLHSFLRIDYGPEGEPLRMIGHRLDITARKRAEEEVRARERRLDAANKELEAFSYSVSHDLRSPLRSIDGFSQALEEDYADKVDAQGRDYLGRVRAATRRMGQLIDDLLNLSRVSRSAMRPQEVNLSTMAETIAADLQHSEPERKSHWHIQPTVLANADPGLMRVVLENLLGNSFKFTGRHAEAKIEFGAKDGVYFVRDDGAGFDPAYAAKLFGAFQRLHAMTDFSGTGIGLATVQRIVHRHGGRIGAMGELEKGATFFFTLDDETELTAP